MLQFLEIIFSLNVYHLDVKFKTMASFNFNIQNVISYNYLKKILNLDHTQTFTYLSVNKNFSEFYTICSSNNLDDFFESRTRISDMNGNLKQRNMTIKLSSVCKYIEICPELKNPIFFDNHIIVEPNNEKKFSLYIWEKLFVSKIIINKKETISNITLLLNRSKKWLKENLSIYPLLYFKDNFENIHDIFLRILHLLKWNNNIGIKELINSSFFDIRKYNSNQIMQRYHMIKGLEINEKSLDFYVGCILMDLANIIGFFNKKDDFCFKIFNIINLENYLYGILYIIFEFKLNRNNILLDSKNTIMIYIHDYNWTKISNFIYRPFKENIFILIPRIYCLDNMITKVKISVYTKEGLFESKFLDIKENIIN